MKNFRVVVSELKGDQGSIASSNLDLRLVTYWKMYYPMYTSSGSYQEQPELLEKVTVNSFKPNACQRYWLNVKIPKDSKAGTYRGTVTLFDENSEKAVQFPISYKVLGYQLKADPNKHYTAFHLPVHHMYKAYTGKLLDKAITTDLQNMLNYGFDIFPDFYLHSRESKNGSIEFYLKDTTKMVIKKAIEFGFKGRVILVGGTNQFYKHYMPNAKSAGGHGKMSAYPKAGNPYYAAITKATKEFMAKWKAKGLPELMFFPFDEPRAHNAEYCAMTYAAIHKAGAQTMVTNDPTTGYAHFYRDHDGVDIWCSQAYAVSYEKTQSDKRYEYWSYPNHNAGEFKNRTMMQKGGRLTAGYGLWRSGYTTLFPWAWRWFPGSDHIEQFDYLKHGRASGTGVRLDENANFIPSIYWECFREGKDDGRYLYTLQQAIVQRQGTSDPKCKILIKIGQRLLNVLWQKVEPQKKYLGVNFLEDESFKSLRWKIASLTLKLLKFPALNTKIAPSVMADTSIKSETKDDAYFIKKGLANNAIDFYDLGKNDFSAWQPTDDKELKYTVNKDEQGKATMHLNITADYGNGPSWPYVKYELANEKISLKDYKFLYCKIKFNSDRDAVSNDVTKLGFVFKNSSGEKWENVDLGGNEQVWTTVQIPLNDPKYQAATKLLILPKESFYADKVHINFTVSDIGLLRFKQPYIKEIKSADNLIQGDRYLKVNLSGYALDSTLAKGCYCEFKLTSKKNKQTVKRKIPLGKITQVIMPSKKLKPGKYQLAVTLYNKENKALSTQSKTIHIIKAP